MKKDWNQEVFRILVLIVSQIYLLTFTLKPERKKEVIKDKIVTGRSYPMEMATSY